MNHLREWWKRAGGNVPQGRAGCGTGGGACGASGGEMLVEVVTVPCWRMRADQNLARWASGPAAMTMAPMTKTVAAKTDIVAA